MHPTRYVEDIRNPAGTRAWHRPVPLARSVDDIEVARCAAPPAPFVGVL